MTQQSVPPQRSDTRFIQLERELRANEDRWGAVFANPFMGISVLDKNHYFIMTNSTYQAMVGYTDDELKKRKANWKGFEPKVKKGYLARYSKLVTNALFI